MNDAPLSPRHRDAAAGLGLDSPYGPPHRRGLPWSTHESGQYEKRHRYEQRKAADERHLSYPSRDLVHWHPRGGTGWRLHYERQLPRWLAKLVKRNTLYIGCYLQHGITIGFVMRWKVVYAPGWIQSVARLTGEHPITIAEHYVATGREIVSAVKDKPDA